jgi:WD40 repeat protein
MSSEETRDPQPEPPTHSFAGEPLTPSYHPPVTVAQTPTQADLAASASAVPPADALPLVPGYELLGLVGEGGMGLVYRARELAFDRDVAVKLLKPRYPAGTPAARRFLDEARITGQLQHPAIPPVHHIGELSDRRPFLAMKLIKGETLADRLDAAGPAERLRLIPAFAQVCQAVAYAHSRKVLHRDLKPHNVMVGAFGEVQVMDWGLAKVLTDARGAVTEVVDPGAGTGTEVRTDRAPDLATQAGAVLGTPAYMAPEQAAGEIDKVDERSDVFGLGAVLCAVLTGHPPYQGPNTNAVRIKAMRGETADAFARLDASGADAELVALCKRCLSADRDARPRNAGEVAKAVAAHLAAVEERARQAELDRVRADERQKKRRVQWVLAGAVLLLLAMAATGATVARLWQDAEVARGEAETQRDAAENAKIDALNQKQIADRAKDEALTQKGFAEKAQKDAEREREQRALVEYGRAMQVAHRAWRENNVVATRVWLDGTDPKLRNWEWRYMNRLCDPSLLTLRGHTGGVAAAAFSPDGTRVVTGGDDHTAKVWDTRTGAKLLTLEGHAGKVYASAFSPDGFRVVTAGWDRTAKVWDARTGAELLTLKGHTVGVWGAAFGPNGTRVVTAGLDGTAKVWDARTGAELLTLKGHTDAVLSAAFSPDGFRVVTAGWDRTAKVWDARTGAELLTLKGHTNWAWGAEFSHDGTRVVTGSGDRTAKVWDARTGAEVLTLKGHAGAVLSAAFSPDGNRVVTASRDTTARVWDARTGAEVLTLKGHAGAVLSAAFSPDGTRVVTGSDDHTAKVWDARTEAEVLALRGHSGGVLSAAFNPDGTRMLTVGWDGTAKVWDTRTGAEVLTLKEHSYRVYEAAFNSDGTRVITWDHSQKLLHYAFKHLHEAFDPNRRQFDTAVRDLGMRVWDARTGAEVLTRRGHIDRVRSAEFSPDGARRVVTGSDDHTAEVQDARTGAEIFTLKGHTDRVAAATFSPDGTRVVTASDDRTAKVWDARTGVEVLALRGHSYEVHAAAFSPDGTRVVTAGWDGMAKVWDARTGAEVLELRGHTGFVYTVAFSPDGTRVVTASDDGTARIWDSRPFRDSRPADPVRQLAPPPRPVPAAPRP